MNLAREEANQIADYEGVSAMRQERFIKKNPVPIYVEQPAYLNARANDPLVIKSPPRPNKYFDEVDLQD